MGQHVTDISIERDLGLFQQYKLGTKEIWVLRQKTEPHQRQEEKHTGLHLMDSHNTQGLPFNEHLESQCPQTASLHLWHKPFNLDGKSWGLSWETAAAPPLAFISEALTTRHKYCNCCSDAPISLLGSTACLG